MNYVWGGYGAVAGILVLYVWHLRHRARVLARVVPPARRPAPGRRRP